MDTAGRVAEGTELANICLIEDLLTRYNASSAEGGWTPMLNWTDGIVCSADAIHPDGAADYVGDGGHGPGVSCWTGFGAALNDPNGAERNWLGEYYVGDGYCHYFVSAGYEAPAAKRPAVRTLPAPGSVNVKSFILWRPYTQVNIANFRTPLPPGTTPTAPPGGTATPTAEETATPIEPASTDTATLLATPSPTPTAIPTSTSTPTRTRTPTPTPTPAPDLAVDTTADDALLADCDPVTPADCSLRGALAKTAGTLTPVRIGVPAGTYVLNGGATCQHVTNQFGTHTLAGTSSLCVRGNVTLAGAGADTTIIDGNATGRVLLVGNAGPVRVEGLTLRGGIQDGSSLFGGGGAVNNGGDLTLADSVVRDSSSTAGGGGIYSSGPLRIERCTITGNTARVGGGVYTDSAFVPVDATILDSTLADNHAAIEHGGGVFVYGSNAGGTTAIRGTTISANDAGTSGGGVALAGLDGTLVLTNSTISGNRCFWYYGGGLADLGRSTIQLRNVTVTGNRSEDAGGTNGAGGGIALDATTTATLANTVIAGNSAAAFAPDCYDATAIIGSDGYNLIGDAGDDGNGGTYCNLGDANGDRRGVDPLLGPLADNGGPTATHAPLAGSPAIDGGNPVGCTDENDTPLATDQRGAPRPVDGDGGDDPRCDAGAVEAQ
ncbi:MAG: right-handed parallel beta-helix repeat-containing protein [Deltaproteobacteria bacterium]|nr:right-handed parallel beta-helix repeat-containing protein [Deltaproteobacteria bacterium]